jgi:hypothetical protein
VAESINTNAAAPLNAVECVSVVPESISSPSNSPHSEISDADENAPEPRPINQVIAKLKWEVSQVKNKRICTLSAYEYMRHLSVLRFLEWTIEEGKPEQDASRQLAELLWEHKTGSTPNSRNSINHKANLIQKWAREYRTTGELEEHAHGTHKKSSSKLAEEPVAKAARKALSKMTKPGPSALKDVLLNEIFPKFGIDEPKISENTCRNYMQHWGWVKGTYKQQWVPKNKKILAFSSSESEEGNHASEETTILETRNDDPPKPSPRKPSWHGPIPSPTTAIRSAALAQPTIMTQPATTLDGLHAPASLTSPTATFTDSTMPMNTRDASVFWPPMQTYPSNQPQIYQFHMPTTFQSTPQLHQSQFTSHTPFRYIPKSLDSLVPDPPDMMGIRPAFNGDPIPTFTPQPSMLATFSHDSTFPPQVNRRSSVNNSQNPNYHPSSQLPFMSDMS